MKRILFKSFPILIIAALFFTLQGFMKMDHSKDLSCTEAEWAKTHPHGGKGMSPSVVSDYTMTASSICTGSVVFTQYDMRYSNYSGNDYTSVILKDTLPAGLTAATVLVNGTQVPGITNAMLKAGIPINSLGAPAGTVAAGKNVTISIWALSAPAPSTTVYNQGFISFLDNGNPFISVSDDPNIAGIHDPTAVVLPSCGVVPVSMINFIAKKDGYKAALSWSTAQEQNSRSFEVQRVDKAGNWKKIGAVAAAGNSSQLRNYSFTDTDPAAGINYYRLQQSDLDGRSTLSNVEAVSFDGKFPLEIFPNPVSDMLTIKGYEGAVKIFSAGGKQVASYSDLKQGEKIDMSSLPAGMYILKLIDKDGNVTVRKVMKK